MNIDIKINSAAAFTNEASNRLTGEGLPVTVLVAVPVPVSVPVPVTQSSVGSRNIFNLHLLFVNSKSNCQWTTSRYQHPNLDLRLPQFTGVHTFSTNLIFKLTQLWLVIILLLPFLFCLTSTSLIRPVSGHDLTFSGPMSNSSSSSFIVSNHSIIRLQQHQYQRVQDTQNGVTVNQTETKCSYKINNNTLNHTYQNRSNTVKCAQFESKSYNHRSNNYSLINLSQSEAESGSVSHANTSAIDDVRIRKRVRTRRTGAVTKQRQHVRSKHIDKEKLTRLVMHGLGIKKLPDMKKANISQLEYSSKYIEYLERIRQHHSRREDPSGGISYNLGEEYNIQSDLANLHLLSIVTNSFRDISRKRWRQRRATRTALTVAQGLDERHGDSDQSSASRDRTSILLHFPLNLNDAIHYDKIDEANVRLMLLYSSALANNDPRSIVNRKKPKHKLNGGKHCHPDESISEQTESAFNPGSPRGGVHRGRFQRRPRILNLRVYQLMASNKRQLLDKRRIEFNEIGYEDTRSQWLEFDVTKAVRGWLNRSHENLGIEIQCDKCRRIGARILSDVSTPTIETSEGKGNDYERDRFHLMPVLNIIGHLGHTQTHRGDPPPVAGIANQYFPHRVEQDFSRRVWPNSCYKVHQRCCRHQLDVVFKDIKGFEFILQPKTFDAGYCQGRCPPRHNPAHHHALLQSLIWQQDHSRVPRPCCAPSKLTELEILHVDEEHSDKLKISTWSDMQVVECACS